jgi:hypothetical protein
MLGMAAAGALISEARADEPEPLDEEFLDYLLQLEGDEEDWTLFDSQEAEPEPVKSTASKPAPTREPVANKSTQSPPASNPPVQSPPPRAQSEVKR